MPEFTHYTKIYVDLYVESFGSDVISTIELDNVKDPLDDSEVRQAVKEIYSHMEKANGRPFKYIKVGGVPHTENGDNEEKELFYVYKEELVKDYGVVILEYTSVWTGNHVCV